MSTITTDAGRTVKADEGESHPDPLAADTVHPTTRHRARALRVTPTMVWVVVAIALVASLALGATRGRDWYAARQTEAANAAAVAAAKQLAINFVTVDYTKVDADVARVKAGATGEDAASSCSTTAQSRRGSSGLLT